MYEQRIKDNYFYSYWLLIFKSKNIEKVKVIVGIMQKTDLTPIIFIN